MKSERTTETKSEAKVENRSINWIERAEPILSGLMSGWRLVPVESKGHEVSGILNMKCGINYLLCSEDTHEVYGVTVRVQYGKNYRTFTVPKESKRASNAAGVIKPYYTMQVYIDDGRIIGLGLVKTSDLMDFIDSGYAMKLSEEKSGLSKFHVCHFDDLRLAGYTVKEFRVEQPAGFGYKVAYHGATEHLEDLDDDDECDECDIRDILDIAAQALSKKRMAYVPF